MPNQIYVVMSQHDPLMQELSEPQQAFIDYPSALAYAKSIYKNIYGSQENPKDLVYLINLTPLPAIPVTTVAKAS